MARTDSVVAFVSGIGQASSHDRKSAFSTAPDSAPTSTELCSLPVDIGCCSSPSGPTDLRSVTFGCVVQNARVEYDDFEMASIGVWLDPTNAVKAGMLPSFAKRILERVDG
jgi:hypothetical protein